MYVRVASVCGWGSRSRNRQDLLWYMYPTGGHRCCWRGRAVGVRWGGPARPCPRTSAQAGVEGEDSQVGAEMETVGVETVGAETGRVETVGGEPGDAPHSHQGLGSVEHGVEGWRDESVEHEDPPPAAEQAPEHPGSPQAILGPATRNIRGSVYV
jgi:hypothetical protein